MQTLLKALMILSVLGLAISASAEEYRDHMLVKVLPDSPAQMKALYRYSNLDVIEGFTPNEPHVAAYPEDLDFLRQHGYRFEILQWNLEQYYADQLAGAPAERDSMGGYYTYYDILNFLDSLHNVFPSIVGSRFSIGNSLQGRGLWAIKISDNPGTDEDEPEVFYNSLIHCREPAAMEATLYFMRYLTYNYAGNSEVQYLVNNREMYFLPCVNPDGYEYNRSTNPNGGGMWRKNRRNNGDGSYGVDLNRNFGVAWGIDNDGSSPIPSDETYRGTAAFSEPETQVIRDFVNSRHFVTEEDFHTYSDLILYPWGTSYYDGDGLTEDNATYEMIADSMNYFIHSITGTWYTTGTAWQTLYNVNGGSFDWEYGDQAAHSKIFALTTEVGSAADGGFWPTVATAQHMCQENLPALKFLARIAGTLAPQPYRVAYSGQCQNEWNGNGNSITEPGEGLTLTVTLRNVGMNTLTSVQGALTSADPYVTVVTGSSSWPNIAPNGTANNTTAFQISVAGNCPSPHFIPCNLHVTAANLDTNLSLSATVGFSSLVDNVEGGVGSWTTGGSNNQWHITTRRANSPTHSWLSGTDGGNYADNMNAYLLSPQLILGPGAELSYDQWYNLESGYDYGHFDVNTGSGWTEIGTSVTGSSGGWLHVARNLGITCPGSVVQIRFRMTSDVNTNAEGWYIDNISTGCPIAPDISISPLNVTGIAPLGGTDSELLQICNPGGCPLTWSISFNQITPPFPMIDRITPSFGMLTMPDLDRVTMYLTKDEGDRRRGREQLDNQGGPDAFGYRWKDSNEPGGPVYQWVELAGIGTNAGFTSDDQYVGLTLPWSFSFYGTGYTALRLSSNGKAHFGTDSSDWRNLTIPSTRLPQSIISPFWDDLSPQQSGAIVYYYNDVANERFIVQYDSVPHYPGVNNGRYTFEMILYQSGRIVFQYQNLVGDLNSCTVGIENSTGTVGLPVVYNANYLTNGLAIAISAIPPWLAFGSPTSGTVEAGQCTNVTLNFTAGSLTAGTYTGELSVTSNDPDENPLDVPVEFMVGQLEAPTALTIYYLPATDELSFHWQSTGAPAYRLYSSTSSDGPFTNSVGSTTANEIEIPRPADALLFYVVVSTDGQGNESAPSAARTLK